jgi:hypothetical protein
VLTTALSVQRIGNIRGCVLHQNLSKVTQGTGRGEFVTDLGVSVEAWAQVRRT